MRVFYGALLGAIVVFVWGFVAWAALDVYSFAFKPFSNEEAVAAALKAGASESGAYVIPAMPTDRHDKAGMDAFEQKQAAGPLALVLYRKMGAPAMDWRVLVRGFSIYLAAGLVLGVLLNALQLRSTATRLAFVILMVSFGLLITFGSQWNWFHMPDKYTIAMCVDGLVGWFLGGGVIAMIVRPSPAAT